MILGAQRRNRQPQTSAPGSRGEQTRQAILERAVKMAVREGLDALTIGRLAKELGMSKSGLFAHFHSKQELELATVEKAKEVFGEAVLRPAKATRGGIERLWTLCDFDPKPGNWTKDKLRKRPERGPLHRQGGHGDAEEGS
jgi:AcrR family transcriptional regulator